MCREMLAILPPTSALTTVTCVKGNVATKFEVSAAVVPRLSWVFIQQLHIDHILDQSST